MSIHGGTMLLYFRQQVGRIRRSDALRSQMTADIEVSRILLLLDGFMMSAGILESVLLRAAVLIQDAIARFKFLPDPRDVFVHDGEFGLVPCQFLSRRSACFRTAEAGTCDFRAFFREADAAGGARGHLRFER